VDYLLQQLANGLVIGSIYALIAVGYNLVYGVLGLINFAHGDTYMVGTYVVFAGIGIGMPFFVAVLCGLAVGGILGLLIERFAYRPLRRADRIAPTVSAVGAALVLSNGVLLVWGPATHRFDSPLPDRPFTALGLHLNTMQFVVFAVTAILAAALYAFVTKSQWGRNVRAIRDDLPTAELIGLPVNRLVSSVYAWGAVLGVGGGVLYASYYHLVFQAMGFQGTLFAFTAAVIGGIGNVPGSFLGGLLLGVVQAIGVGYLSSGYMNAITFMTLILFLVIRPYGLLGKADVSRA
jgi:branched-chain amino acid transport system permease protein